MLTRSDCAKMASPVVKSNEPARALPLTTRSQVSCSASRHQAEFGARSIRSNVKCEFETRSVRVSVSRVRRDAKIGGAGIRHRNGVLDMKFTPAAMIEKTKCRVAALLDLRDHKTCADRVDRSGGDENSVARTHRLPHDKIRDRAVIDGVTQLLRGKTPFQAQGDLGLGRGTQDVPGFGFAVRQSDRLRVRIIRMNLDGKRLVREQQLQQKRRSGGRRTGTLVPDFADRIAVIGLRCSRDADLQHPKVLVRNAHAHVQSS